MVKPDVTSNLVHPRAKACVRTVTVAIFQDAKEHFLHQVFAHGPVTGQPQIKIE